MSSLLDITGRTAVVYIVILVGLRLLGKRHLAQISISDFVLILLISNAVQNAMVGDNNSLLGGIAAAATLLVLNYLFTFMMYRFGFLRRAVEGDQVVLIYDGHIVEDNLQQERISHDELQAIIREHGVDSISEVHGAILEVDGSISVVPKAIGNAKPQSFNAHRKRTKFNRQDKAGS
jgi:uncharacterized membrane protein YcaP (DUF421 family)